MNYDDWKSTDPADSDPYRDDDDWYHGDDGECLECGAGHDQVCREGCGCPDCFDEDDDL